MDTDFWTNERIETLRKIFFEKWKSLNEEERAWSDYLLKHCIFVMGPRDVSATLNSCRWCVCIENPTIADRYEPGEFMIRSDVVGMIELGGKSTYSYLLREEAWYLIPEAFAKKAIVLGLP